MLICNEENVASTSNVPYSLSLSHSALATAVPPHSGERIVKSFSFFLPTMRSLGPNFVLPHTRTFSWARVLSSSCTHALALVKPFLSLSLSHTCDLLQGLFSAQKRTVERPLFSRKAGEAPSQHIGGNSPRYSRTSLSSQIAAI
jgi:hypothetical protein